MNAKTVKKIIFATVAATGSIVAYHAYQINQVYCVLIFMKTAN